MRPEAGRKRKRWLWIVGAVLVLSLASFGAYKYWFEQPTQAQIDEAFEAEEWSRVASLIRRADLTHDDGRNHFRLGTAYERMEDDLRAIEAYMEADDKGFSRAESRARIAALYAKLGKSDLAIQWVSDAMDVGYAPETDEDPLISELSKTVAWREFFDRTGAEDEEPSEALDFLLGTWSVARGGGPGSRSVIVSKAMDGAISESWQIDIPGGANGFFVLDPATERWRYTYIDGFGRVFEGDVRFTRRQVTISGVLVYANGVEVLHKIEIRASSGLIDYIVSDSRDGGRTWDDEDRRRLTSLGEAGRPSF